LSEKHSELDRRAIEQLAGSLIFDNSNELYLPLEFRRNKTSFNSSINFCDSVLLHGNKSPRSGPPILRSRQIVPPENSVQPMAEVVPPKKPQPVCGPCFNLVKQIRRCAPVREHCSDK